MSSGLLGGCVLYSTSVECVNPVCVAALTPSGHNCHTHWQEMNVPRLQAHTQSRIKWLCEAWRAVGVFAALWEARACLRTPVLTHGITREAAGLALNRFICFCHGLLPVDVVGKAHEKNNASSQRGPVVWSDQQINECVLRIRDQC